MADLVVILGAGPGLGLAIGQAFAAAGARVALIARDPDKLAALAAEVGPDTIVVAADAGDEASLRAGFASLRAQAGDPTVLVHNASVLVPGGAVDTTPDQLVGGLRVGAVSLLVAVQEVLPAMQAAGAGTVLVTGGGAADRPWSGSLALGAQKAALRNIAREMAGELAPAGVHVAQVTIRGTIGTPGFEPAAIATHYTRLHSEQPGAWRTEIDFPPTD